MGRGEGQLLLKCGGSHPTHRENGSYYFLFSELLNLFSFSATSTSKVELIDEHYVPKRFINREGKNCYEATSWMMMFVEEY